MPGNKKQRGMKVLDQIRIHTGAWVNNMITGTRMGKNSTLFDSQCYTRDRKNITHTSPIKRTPENDGHDNPARMRAAATKFYRESKVLHDEH